VEAGLGEYQAQAAIAALHADARTAAETDWVQSVEWYDELPLLTDSPVVRLNRPVAVGEADGPRAGLAALAGIDPGLPGYAAVTAYLLERGHRVGALDRHEVGQAGVPVTGDDAVHETQAGDVVRAHLSSAGRPTTTGRPPPERTRARLPWEAGPDVPG